MQVTTIDFIYFLNYKCIHIYLFSQGYLFIYLFISESLPGLLSADCSLQFPALSSLFFNSKNLFGSGNISGLGIDLSLVQSPHRSYSGLSEIQHAATLFSFLLHNSGRSRSCPTTNVPSSPSYHVKLIRTDSLCSFIFAGNDKNNPNPEVASETAAKQQVASRFSWKSNHDQSLGQGPKPLKNISEDDRFLDYAINGLVNYCCYRNYVRI